MAIDKVRTYFAQLGREEDILEFNQSSATVELAAQALNVEPARIAKTLAFKDGELAILVVTAGDQKIDNKKFKDEFGFKAKMLNAEEVLSFTGHAVGGVCPFGLANNLKVYLDDSMKRFNTIYPACGSANSAIELTCNELEQYAGAEKWVAVCK